jgi:hypothetical protein
MEKTNNTLLDLSTMTICIGLGYYFFSWWGLLYGYVASKLILFSYYGIRNWPRK